MEFVMGRKASNKRPLAVVTGASTGIGYELARCCAENGFDLIVAADEPEIEIAARNFRNFGGTVEAVEADLATIEGVEKLYAAIGGKPVDALLANAGRGIGGAFLDENFNDVIRVVDTNVTGTLYSSRRSAATCETGIRVESSSPARSQAIPQAPSKPSITAPRLSSIHSLTPCAT